MNQLHTCYKLIPIHPQVFLHAAEKSIIDIRLVDVLQEVPDRGKREDEGVEFEEEPALVGGELPCIPQIALPCLDGLYDNVSSGVVWCIFVFRIDALRRGDYRVSCVLHFELGLRGADAAGGKGLFYETPAI